MPVGDVGASGSHRVDGLLGRLRVIVAAACENRGYALPEPLGQAHVTAASPGAR